MYGMSPVETKCQIDDIEHCCASGRAGQGGTSCGGTAILSKEAHQIPKLAVEVSEDLHWC